MKSVVSLRRRGISITGLIALALAMIAVAITATTALAASTRVEYVAQVDPICQAGHAQEKADKRSYKKRIRPFLRRGIDQEHPPKAAVRILMHYYDVVADIRRNEDAQISPIPAAPGDEMAVSGWLQKRGEATDLLERSIGAIAHGKFDFAGRLLSKASKKELGAEAFLEGFGFKYCTPFLANP